jgi:hypothetical protein
MLKQTYTEVKEELISFMLEPHNHKCSKCQEVRHCNPDDYRVESGEFCTPEDYLECPLVNIMGEAMALADEMEYQDTFNGRELLSHWKKRNIS